MTVRGKLGPDNSLYNTLGELRYYSSVTTSLPHVFVVVFFSTLSVFDLANLLGYYL